MGVKVFVSSAGMLCDSARTKALGHLQTRHVTTEKQIRYARTWPCEMSEGYHSPAAPIYPPFHGHLRNNSVKSNKRTLSITIAYLYGT